MRCEGEALWRIRWASNDLGVCRFRTSPRANCGLPILTHPQPLSAFCCTRLKNHTVGQPSVGPMKFVIQLFKFTAGGQGRIARMIISWHFAITTGKMLPIFLLT